MTAAASDITLVSPTILTPKPVARAAPEMPINRVINAEFLTDGTLTLNRKARILSQRLRESSWPARNRHVELLINDLDDFDEESEQYNDRVFPWYSAALDFDTMITQLNKQAAQDQM